MSDMLDSCAQREWRHVAMALSKIGKIWVATLSGLVGQYTVY